MIVADTRTVGQTCLTFVFAGQKMKMIVQSLSLLGQKLTTTADLHLIAVGTTVAVVAVADTTAVAKVHSNVAAAAAAVVNHL